MGKGYKKKRNKNKVREHRPRPDAVEGLNFVSSVVDRGNFKMEYVATSRRHVHYLIDRLIDRSID